ncbi:MAG: membrane dipeptidase [Clostridia bacterium]|nr:membrane dipeptidase [Clostridia bacterium]
MKFFDLHCDTPYECYKRSTDLSDRSLAVNKYAAEKFDLLKQCFAIWISEKSENPFLLYKNILNDFNSKIKDIPKNLIPVLTVEGGAVIGSDIEKVYALKSDGIKALTLTWNGKNAIASGANETGGVTAFGKEVINVLNNLKIACDLSHLNRKSFLSAVDMAKYPIATHSCLNEVNFHKRNLSISDVKLIAEKGGIIGICLYPDFLGKDVFENFYKTVFLMLDNGLENSIAIGSDFDGADMTGGIKSTNEIPLLYGFLKQKGIDIKLLDKIFYENAENFFLKL